MELDAKYKQTEVGVIPEDWEVPFLRQHLLQDATYGVVKAGTFQRTGIPMLRGGDIKNGSIAEDQPLITAEKSEEYSRTILKAQDVVIALVGYPGETAVIPERLVGSNISRAVGLLRPAGKLRPEFLACYLNSPDGRKEFLRPSAGSAQIVVNLSALNQLRLPLPPVAEQRAIAEALSDADALIESLEQLIAKKRLIKEGTMQELLTGRRRLPGFEKKHGHKETEVGLIPQDWNSVSILEMCDDREGSIKIGPFGSQLKRSSLVLAGYKLYCQENVYAEDMEIGDKYLTKEHFQKLRSCELLPGDFIVSMMGTIGQCMIVPDGIQPGIIDSHLIRIRLNPKIVVPKYLSHYYSSQLVLNQIFRLQVGGIMAGLSSSIVKQVYVGLPGSTKEQSAVATILSDIDTEIAALEERLEKARLLKQGMMKELLTGKTRLVKPQEAA